MSLSTSKSHSKMKILSQAADYAKVVEKVQISEHVCKCAIANSRDLVPFAQFMPAVFPATHYLLKITDKRYT